MPTRYPELMEKVARIGGASRPSGMELADSSRSMDARRAALARYLEQKGQEKPSSRAKWTAGGAGLGALGGLGAMMAIRKGRVPHWKYQWQIPAVMAALGAVPGGLAGFALAQADRGRTSYARKVHQEGEPSINTETARRIRSYRRVQQIGKALNAALPVAQAGVEQYGLSQRAKSREAWRASQRECDTRQALLAKLQGRNGAEAAARGHFGKSLDDLTARQLAVVGTSLEKVSAKRPASAEEWVEASLGKTSAELTLQQVQALQQSWPQTQAMTWQMHMRPPNKAERDTRYRKLLASTGIASGLGFATGGILAAMAKRKGLKPADLKKLRYLLPLLVAAGSPPATYLMGKKLYVDQPVRELRRAHRKDSRDESGDGGRTSGRAQDAHPVPPGRVSPDRPPAPPIFPGIGERPLSPLAVGGRRPPVGHRDPGDPYARFRYVGR